MSIRHIHRRTVLRGLTAVAIGLPLLELMGSQRRDGEIVRANDRAREPGGELDPRRLFIFCTPNGTLGDAYFPAAGGGETGFVLPAMHSGFAALRDRLVFLDGVDNTVAPEGGHENGQCSLLTGWKALAPDNADELGEGPSVDQQIAAHLIETDPTVARDVLLALGTNDSGGWSGSLSYEGPRTPATKISSAMALFEKLFAEAQIDPARAARLARRASIIDDVIGDYRSLQNRLGKPDQERLEAHLDSLRHVETRLQLDAKTCAELPPAPEPGAWNDSQFLPQVLEGLLAVTAQAFACDLTRVVTLMVRSAGGQTRYTFPWMEGWGSCPATEGGPDGFCVDQSAGTAENQNHHEMSHHDGEEPARSRLLDVNRWQMDQLASFATSLDTTGLLDSSLLVHCSGIARGDHGLTRLPLLLVGSLGGKIATGRRLQLSGQPLNDLWLAIQHAMGDEERTSFSDPAHCTGPLPGLLA